MLYEPSWFYLARASLSGELKEYRKVASDAGFIPLTASNKEWFRWINEKLIKLGRDQRNSVAFANPERNQ